MSLRVLVACEESQAVCKAFREKCHEAYSCDIQDCSGGHPEWHIKGDATEALYSKNWQLIIAHPPCTFMANSGVRWLFDSNGKRIAKRWVDLYRALKFWNEFIIYQEYTGVSMAIENPIPHRYAKNSVEGWPKGIGNYNQIIHPWQFGHLETKQTCLWLHNLPLLMPTNNVQEEMMKLPYGQRAKVHHAPPGPERAKIRSKTYEGIAKAMADQWGDVNQKQYKQLNLL